MAIVKVFILMNEILKKSALQSGASLYDVVSRRLLLLCGVFFVANIAARVFIYANAGGPVTGNGELIGTDFLAFWTAAKSFVAGEGLAMYDPAQFQEALSGNMPGRYQLLWLYPPTVFFLIAPLAWFDYITAYALWMAITLTGFAFVLRSVVGQWRLAFILLCGPLCVLAVNAGQISFVTAALLLLAAFNADRKPILAGITAGLLTIKPQLGLLLPIAFVVSGCWRAFVVAAVTAVLMFISTTFVFGIDGWLAFLGSTGNLYAEYAEQTIAPARNMTSLMSQLILLGVPSQISQWVHFLFIVPIVAMVAVVWRFGHITELKAAALCSASMMISPYIYSYEMVVLLATVGVIAARAVRSGWLRYERLLIFGSTLWLLMPWLELLPLQRPFILSFACLILVVRRLYIEDLAFASKAKQLFAIGRRLWGRPASAA